MAKIQPATLSNAERTRLLEKLYKAIDLLKTKQEVIDFFHDVLTQSESIMLARRFKIARLLRAGLTFNQIRQETGASPELINTVKQSMDYGRSGYARIIDRMKLE